MSWDEIITSIVKEFHQKYGCCTGAVWVWALCSPLKELYDKDPEMFCHTSNEAWADQLYEWCVEDEILEKT